MLRVLSTGPAWVVIDPDLCPLFVGLGVGVALLLAVFFRRRLGAWLVRLRLSERLFQIACVLLFVPLFLRFVAEARAPAPDSKALAALAALLLVLALGAQYGQALFVRLKKLGPLELFEQKAPELIERLNDVLEPLDVDIAKALHPPLSPEAEYAYQYANALIRYLEFSGTAPSSEMDKKRFGDLLFKLAQLASLREDWWVARRALERLRSLLGREFEGFKVAYNLGRAYLECAAGRADRNELLQKALNCFAEAADRNPHDWESFFWLAYVQVDLRMFDPAIANNRKVLELRHGFAPAKYNIVISRIKKGEMEQALADLLAIGPHDEQGLDALQKAASDDEIRPLLTHPVHGSRARWWLKHHQDPTRSLI